jgi:hypothetical protein
MAAAKKMHCSPILYLGVLFLPCQPDDFLLDGNVVLVGRLRHLLPATSTQVGCLRVSALSTSKVIPRVILFHHSGYRTMIGFYRDYVKVHMHHLFPKTVSYYWFTKLIALTKLPLAMLFKNMCQGEPSRHRLLANYLSNLLAGLATYPFFPKKPAIKFVPFVFDLIIPQC